MNNATLEMIVKSAPQKQTTTQGKSIAEFIATIPQLDERSVDKDVTVKVFGKRAESLPSFPVGQGIVVIGNINIDSVDNPAGYKDKLVTVMANGVLLGSLSPVEASEDNPAPQSTPVAVAPAAELPKPPAALLKAIANAEDDAALLAIKDKAIAKGIPFESFKTEYDQKSYEIIPF